MLQTGEHWPLFILPFNLGKTAEKGRYCSKIISLDDLIQISFIVL